MMFTKDLSESIFLFDVWYDECIRFVSTDVISIFYHKFISYPTFLLQTPQGIKKIPVFTWIPLRNKSTCHLAYKSKNKFHDNATVKTQQQGK